MSEIKDHEIIRTAPSFFTEKRIACLRICLTHINQSRKIGKKKLSRIINEFCTDRKGNISDKKLVILHDVLNRLNELGISDSILPVIAQKPFRPSLIPKTTDEFLQVAECPEILNFFWGEWLAQQLNSTKNIEEVYAFAFVLSAASESAVGKHIVHDIITNLVSENVNDDLSVRVKIHPKDSSMNYSILSLATPTRFILASWLKKRNSRKEKYIFLPSLIRSRKEQTLKILEKSYQSLIASYCDRHPNAHCPKTWSSFGNIASIMPVFDQRIGLEPYIFTAQSAYPLPVSHPSESDLALRITEGTSTPASMITHKAGYRQKKHQLATIKFESENLRNTDDNDWTGKSKSILRALNRSIDSVVKEHQAITAEGVTKKVLLRIAEAKQKADKLTRNNSALHLALAWIQYKIIHDQIKASTVKKYLSRVFINGILTDPDSIDFATWEPEDHELLFEDIISRDSIKSERTRQSILIPYKQAYKYGNDHGFFSGVDISYVSDEWGGGTARNELIGLGEFDAFIRMIMEADQSHHSTMIAVVCILAFYGGMRSGEISRLSLKDVEVMAGFLFVDIHKGKSAAARRRIPLHLISPQYCYDIINDYYQFRRQQFRKDAHLKDIPLFGPNKIRERYTRHSLADVAIGMLQQYFGSSITLHSLRHAACSWLLVRIYCCRYPDLITELKERNHESFSIQYIQRAAYLFSGEESDHIPDYCGSSLIRLSKLIGHLGARTMFNCYIHTFHLLQSHAMKRISIVYGERTLNGKTISALVPKMHSKTSQAKLLSKTINGILEQKF